MCRPAGRGYAYREPEGAAVSDLTFIARVAEALLADPEAQRSWRDWPRLVALAGPHRTLAEIRRAAADPEFAASLRQLVVDAYAEPALAAGLPDPAPRLG